MTGGEVVGEEAVALWTTAPGVGALRAEELPDPQPGEALVETLWTGVSRGTETLVARGEVPDGEKNRMRAPFQAGDFPFPVKYGYLAVGESAGRTVFALHPHQSRFVVPEAELVPVPTGVPPRRAVLAGAVETAVNVLWDARPLVGDRIAVIGAGMIGGAIAAVGRRIPGVSVTLVDIDPSKQALADALGVAFGDAADPDIVIEASGQASGLQHALHLAPDDGEVVVASWYGSRAVPVELGGDFHSRRLTIRSSQVGVVAAGRRARRSTRERLTLALRLLEDPDFDALLGGTTPWMRAPDVVAALAAGTADDLCHTIDWSAT